MATSLPVTASHALLLPVRNIELKGVSLCAGPAANATLEVFDGVFGTIATAALNAAGTGYSAADVLSLESVSSGAKATVRVDTVDGLVGEILTKAIANGGTLYAVGDTITLVQAGGGIKAVFTVATVDAPGTGVITGLTLVSGGSGYTGAATYATTTNSVAGTGCTVTASTVAVGAVTAITLLTGGAGYVATTTYAVTGGTGNDDATITASTVTDDALIAKLAAVTNESAPPVELCTLTTKGITVRISGTNAKGHIYYD